MMDTDSKQDLLKEISEIRALLSRLQPVTDGGGTAKLGVGRRVLILF
jgi:hypothetical protein